MTATDTEYYRNRADEERIAARQARERYVGEIHMELAKAYEALAQQPELRIGLKVATG